MSYTEEDLWSLLREADDMPYGAAQIALVEQVIAHADAMQLTSCSSARGWSRPARTPTAASRRSRS